LYETITSDAFLEIDAVQLNVPASFENYPSSTLCKFRDGKWSEKHLFILCTCIDTSTSNITWLHWNYVFICNMFHFSLVNKVWCRVCFVIIISPAMHRIKIFLCTNVSDMKCSSVLLLSLIKHFLRWHWLILGSLH